ncbi:MAG: helicase-exonuclease AddAB subunit AddA [Clostridia bacterium]|nr:helicase-exonuclease AddAB subunit AddA [Clostridia bacterium]
MARIWTDSQKQAIESRNGTVLVSAAAGSGKTAVLVERVIGRITDAQNPVDIEKLLVVTYTKAAAAEMKERISVRLSEMIAEEPTNSYLKRQKMYLPNAQISTMDSFCGRIVKENFEKADISPDFTMMSDIEHDILKRETVSEVLEEIYNLPESETKEFLDLFTNGRNDENLINSIFALYDFAMASQNPLQWVENAFSDYFGDLSIHETKWGKFSLNRLAEVLEFIKIKANDIIDDAPENSNLLGAVTNDLTPIIVSIDYILETIYNHPEKWDEIKSMTSLLKFNTFPRVSKDEKDCYYEELKGRRDSIKKYFALADSILICNEKEYKEDIDYLRPIMNVLKGSVIKFIELLNNKKRESNSYYFSDILHFALKILVEFNNDGTYEKTALAKEMSDNFAEILIDEFQDTNEAQDTLFSVISNNNENKFMVGDVKQSIYRFRQAMPEIFMGYKDGFAVYKGGNYPATINLDRNFRSRKGIVEGINFFFDFLMTKSTCGIDYKNGESLHFGADYEPGTSADVFVHVIETDKTRGSDLVAEARHIGNEIKRLVSSGTVVGKKGKERPIKYSDICVLLRAVKDKAPIISRELTEMGIPAYFQKQGGFFESREIVTLISMLKVIDNPVQDVPLVSVMLSPLFPFTEDDLARYRCDQRKGSFYTALKEQYDKDSKVKDFFDLLSVLRTLSATMDIGSLIRRILEITSYDSIVGAMDSGEKRVLNIELLINYAEGYESSSGSGLSGFIRFLDKIRKNNKDLEGANEISENDDVVRIMSIHKSKGLEFPVVFVANCSSSMSVNDFNKVKINRNLGIGTSRYIPELYKDFTTLPFNSIKLFDSMEESAELIRVLYVAMTRAEEKLYLVGSMNNCEKKITELYRKCYVNFTDPAIPLSMCSSFMQWILLAMMYHPSMKSGMMLNCCKNPESPQIDFQIVEKPDEVEITEQETVEYNPDKEMLNEISERLSFEYPFAEISSVPIKYAASSMDREENLKYLATENPAFSGSGELTPAQRGTLTHRFMEICDLNRLKTDLAGEIAKTVESNIFTQKEADAMNISAIQKFLSSDLYNRILTAEKYIREQEFSMSIPVSMVNNSLSENVSDEKVIVQGIIDGLIINGRNGEIVDYKTDRVETMEELCERYKGQMTIYKKAAEECFELQNVTVTLYSFHLSKEISIKL